MSINYNLDSSETKYSNDWYEKQNVESLVQEITDQQKKISHVAFDIFGLYEKREFLSNIFPKMIQMDTKESNFIKLFEALSICHLLPEQADNEGHVSLLLSCIEKGNLGMAKYLVNNKIENCNYLQLHDILERSITNNFLEFIKFCVDEKKMFSPSTILSDSERGRSVWDIACELGNVNVVKYFLKQDVNLDQGMKVALDYMHVEVVKILLEHGAKVTNPNLVLRILDFDDTHLIDLAIKNGTDLVQTYLLKKDDFFSHIPSFKILQHVFSKGISENELSHQDVLLLSYNFSIKNDLAGLKWTLGKLNDQEIYQLFIEALQKGRENTIQFLLPHIKKGDLKEFFSIPELIASSISENHNYISLLKEAHLINFSEDIKKYSLDIFNRALKIPNNLTLIELLLENGLNPSAKINEDTLAEMAVKNNRGDVLKTLIARGIDINEGNLLSLSCKSISEDCFTILLKAGADPNKGLPLFEAFRRADMERIIELIDKGANINAVDPETGNTVTHEAMQASNFGMAEFLINRGGDLSIKNKEGKTPLDLATKEQIFNLINKGFEVPEKFRLQAELLKSIEKDDWVTVEQLLRRGVPLTSADYPDLRPFHKAVEFKLPSLMSLLKERGWNINQFDESGFTPLLSAASLPDNKTIIEALVKEGADLNKQDTNGYGPIHYAIYNNKLENLRVLANLGCNISQQSYEGVTPLQLSEKENLIDLSKTLIEFGASLTEISRSGKTALDYFWDYKTDLMHELLRKAAEHVKDETISQLIKDSFDQKVHIMTVKNAILAIKDDQKLMRLLPLLLMFNDLDFTRRIIKKIPSENFEKALAELKSFYPSSNINHIRYAEFDIITAHFKAGAPIVVDEDPKENMDPAILTAAFKGLTDDAELNAKLELKIKNIRDVPSGKPVEEIDDAQKAYFATLDQLQIMFRSERLLRLIPDPAKRMEFLNRISESQTAKELHHTYMDIAEYHMEREFSLINFKDQNLPNYRDPSKISFEGQPKSVVFLIDNIKKMMKFTKERTYYTGTPPEGSPELEAFYQKLETKIDKYLQELIVNKDQEQKTTILIDLGKETGYCAAKWIQNVSQHIRTLKGDVKVESFEDKAYQALQNLRSGIIQDMVTGGNVHEYNHFVSQVGEELNLPDAETFKDHHDIFEGAFKTKDEIRRDFDKHLTPSRIIEFMNNFLLDEYKSSSNKNLAVDWFKDHIPNNYGKEYYDPIIKEVNTMKSAEKPMDQIYSYLKSKNIYVKPGGDPLQAIQQDKIDEYLENEFMENGVVKPSAVLYFVQKLPVPLMYSTLNV